MPSASDVISHWHHSVEDLSSSSLDFYVALESALKGKEAPVRTERIELGEGGILSAKRTYLRVSYERFVFDIGAAPFGKDFLFSWWLGRRVLEFGGVLGCGVLIGLPVVLFICFQIAGAFVGFVLFAALLIGILMYMQNGGMIGDATLGDIMLTVPILGPLYLRFFKSVTYYSEDTRIMFEETVHRVVLDVVAGILTLNSMRPLTPEETIPKKRKVD